MIDQQRLKRAQRNEHDPPRSIDQFYEEASANDLTPLAIEYWIIFLALGLANSGDAAEITTMNFVLSNEDFDAEILLGDFKTRGSVLAACIFAGMLFGGLLTGAFGDQLGRRPTLLLGLSINSVAGILCSMIPSFFPLCVLRFAAGLGIGAILSSLVTLATESSPPSKRGRNVAFVGCFFTFGTVFVALLAYFLFGKNDVSWRVFVAISALPSLLGMIMVYTFVPESARYLALQNRPEEACATANKIADAMGYRGPPLDLDEVVYHHSTHNGFSGVKVGKGLRDIVIFNGIQAIRNIKNLYFKDIRTKTIILQLIWVSLSFGAGLTTWINVLLRKIHVTDVYLNSLFYSLASIPGNVTAAVLMDRMGRKSLMAISMGCASISLLFFARIALEGTPDSATTSIIFACLFHAFIVIGWGAVNVITSESFPTEVRSTGLGVCAASARLVAMFVQYVNGSLIDRPDILLSIAAFAMFFGAIMSFALNDTSIKPLKDTIILGGVSVSEHQRRHIEFEEKQGFIANDGIQMRETARVEFV